MQQSEFGELTRLFAQFGIMLLASPLSPSSRAGSISPSSSPRCWQASQSARRCWGPLLIGADSIIIAGRAGDDQPARSHAVHVHGRARVRWRDAARSGKGILACQSRKHRVAVCLGQRRRGGPLAHVHIGGRGMAAHAGPHRPRHARQFGGSAVSSVATPPKSSSSALAAEGSSSPKSASAKNRDPLGRHRSASVRRFASGSSPRRPRRGDARRAEREGAARGHPGASDTPRGGCRGPRSAPFRSFLVAQS